MQIQIDGGASDGEALVVDGERYGLIGNLLRQCQGCGKKNRDKRENDSHNFLLINLGTKKRGELAGWPGRKVKRESADRLVLDAALGQDAFLVGVFHFAHLGDGVGKFDEKRVSVASGEDDVNHLWPVA